MERKCHPTQLCIMPIKTMLSWAREADRTDAAVLVAASYEVDVSNLPVHHTIAYFDDLDYECPGRSFTPEQAAQCAAFVRNLTPDIQTVVCACNAGESRSAALCAALCEYFRVDSDWIWASARYHPNMLVFDLMTKALGVPVSDERMDALFFTNRNAFAEAIRRARQ